jgi:hypothetical protein
LIVRAIKSVNRGLRPVSSIDFASESESIVARVTQLLRNTPLVVFDVSGCNPNVMFELGIRDNEGKPFVLISRDVESLPFFLRAHRCLEYDPSASGLERAIPILANMIEGAILHTFDSTVLPIIWDEVMSRQLIKRDSADREHLMTLLVDARVVYDSIRWPEDFDRQTLIVSVARVAIALASYFSKSHDLIAVVCLRILRLRGVDARELSPTAAEELYSLAQAGEETDICDFIHTAISGLEVDQQSDSAARD